MNQMMAGETAGTVNSCLGPEEGAVMRASPLTVRYSPVARSTPTSPASVPLSRPAPGKTSGELKSFQSMNDGKKLTLSVHSVVECCDGETSGDSVLELPFSLEIDKLHEKYPFDEDNDDCYFEELNEAIPEGVSEQAEDFMADVCSNVSCGDNIS
jgi:hypothetical protein